MKTKKTRKNGKKIQKRNQKSKRLKRTDLAYHLKKIPDFRSKKGRQYPLYECLLLIIWGLMAGLVSVREIARTAKIKDERDQSISKALDLKHGIPSHDTLSRILREVDPVGLEKAFMNWISAIAKDGGSHLAIDGKAIKASVKKTTKHSLPPYVINVVDTKTGICLAQMEIPQKSSEKSCVPALIRKLCQNYPDLMTGVDITTDALSMNSNTMEACHEANITLTAPVKKNQKTLLNDVELLMDSKIQAAKENNKAELRENSLFCLMQIQEELYELDFESPSPYIPPKKKHGRKEKRIYITYVLNEDEVLEGFEDIRTITKVVRFREESQSEREERDFSIETVYYQSTAPMDAKDMQNVISTHWAVETCNYFLDCDLGEDSSTAKKRAALPNRSLLRRAALNTILCASALKSFNSFKDKQTFCRENPDIAFTFI